MKPIRKSNPIILHRDALYQEVWETPMRQLAKQYDISDVGLAKICRKMDIPTPPRGYWAKHANGQRVEKTLLSSLSETGCTQITFDKSLQELESVAKKRRILKEQRQTEQQKINRLKSELQDWDTSCRIRMYIAMLRTQPGAARPDQAEFLAWAAQYADHLDPTVDFRLEALDEA
ncbi:MAG: hypothetical protein KGI29_06745 [Pseudomonadota bacterium]|nr:hypothetical protein [Pseudomonadota bacterium]MDE3037567.1 hypothetical protein [Pseudomonadota bacterium]